jgi:hypothetical protein
MRVLLNSMLNKRKILEMKRLDYSNVIYLWLDQSGLLRQERAHDLINRNVALGVQPIFALELTCD